MTIEVKRTHAVRETMRKVKTTLRLGVSVETIEEAKQHLYELAAQKELFPRSDFPVPDAETREIFTCIYLEADGSNGLYVNSAIEGQVSPVHDHGSSWAIVVAVEGREKHYVYRRVDNGYRLKYANVQLANELIVEPGHGVSLLEGGIHSIESTDSEPLLHLHCYGLGFGNQTTRQQFDLESGEITITNDIGPIKYWPNYLQP